MPAALQGPELEGESGAGDTDTTLTISVAVAAGADRCIGVCVRGEGDGTATQAQVTSIVRDGQNAVFHDRQERSDWSWAEIWHLVAPNVGTANLVITISEGDTFNATVYVANGVDQTTPLRAAAKATGSAAAATATVAGVGADDLCFDALAIDSTGHAALVGADQTERTDEETGGVTGCSSTQPGSAGGVMSWTWTGSAPYSFVATAFIAAAAAGVQLAATIASRGQMSAGLRVEKPLGATIASRGTLAAALRVEKPLGATIAGVATMTASLAVEKRLAATIASVGRMSAALEAGGGGVVRKLRMLLGVGR